jgi:hypothetical protein
MQFQQHHKMNEINMRRKRGGGRGKVLQRSSIKEGIRRRNLSGRESADSEARSPWKVGREERKEELVANFGASPCAG